ncbi:glycosyltransferase family 4 protein [Vibrio metschnikovii]|uniref:glycosyltransferase family 4 protein n=1 Tax=Vibrio metschnikovii TaxID=28172 RepID=UPI001C2FC417|nr:glycosyltransferase [Vibrio metschnikovii]
MKSDLKKANELLRNSSFKDSLALYNKVKMENEELANVINFNIKLIERRLGKSLLLPDLEPIKKLPITALVITWDVGHNPLGRSYMLAEALERSVRNVVIAGFQFPRYGDDIWEPVRHGNLPVIALPGGNMDEWLSSCESAVERFKPDIVIACKPRLPSVEFGIMFKEKYNIPLIVDVDDHELSFFNNASPISIAELKNIDKSELLNNNEPYSKIWTQLTENLTKNYADEIITSNIALEKEFGGTIIPHVRDEKSFDPNNYNKRMNRIESGIPENSKIVMFFGTPRIHKGISDIARAIGRINDPNVILVIVGESTDKSVTSQLDKLANGKIIYLPNQPFSKIPEVIVMADLVILPQDVNHPISKYQLPAKAIDAIGLGIPLFVSGTEPLMQLVDDGVATLLPKIPLEDVIRNEIYNSVSEDVFFEVRKKFLLNYSYHSAALKLKKIIERAQKSKRKSLDGFDNLKLFQKQIYCKESFNTNKNGINIVVFWKQNDTGLYGRRSDMIIKSLASREDVRKVIVFDSPVSQFDIENMKSNDPLDQKRNVYIKIYEKLFGKMDSQKISYNVFNHPPGIYTIKKEGEKGKKILIEDYEKYIVEVLNREGIKSSESIFWFYPKINFAEDIIERFNPRKVVVDIVDDHRAWPNVSEKTKHELTEHYKSLLKKSDIAFANCQPVIDSMRVFNENIKLVPNGCEENPLIIEPKNNPAYQRVKMFTGKVIGFVGNLEAKIDIELLESIADKFKDSLIVLIGSTHSNPEVRKLEYKENVLMTGIIEYKYVNSFVSLFDVGLVPHRKMALTNNMNPLKVFVYAANSVPIVVSNVENINDEGFIFKSLSHEEFISNVDYCLKNRASKESFIDFIKTNSWTARLEKIVDGIV